MHTNLSAKFGKFLLGFLLIGLVLCSAGSGSSVARAQEAGTPQPGTVATVTPDEYGTFSALSLSDGTLIERHGINGPSVPPPGFEAERQAVDLSDNVNGLSYEPGTLWVFGCSATAAGDIAAIYDREDGQNEYSNIYTGPTNNGVMPLGNEDNPWPLFADSSSGLTCSTAIYSSNSSVVSALDGGDANGIYHSNPLIASMKGVDGRTDFGTIDDYWVAYNSPDPDPYTGNGEGNACPLSLPMGENVSSLAGWPQHAWGDAIGDYMFTSQSAYGNADGETAFYNYINSADPLTCDVMESQHLPDGTLGRKNFYEARGYAVTECYNQRTDNVIAGGFSFEDYKTEIDAGRPVMLGLEGHSIVGIGYDDSSNTVYLHDGWDYDTHEMVWGGNYAGMALQDVSIVNLAPLRTISGNTGAGDVTLSYTNFTPKTVTSDASGDYSITISSGWDGTVTPSKLGYAFLPEKISYTDVTTDQTNKDYEEVSVPIVTSIVRASPSSTTNATSVDFTVTFSEPVTDVDTADFKLTNTTLTGTSVTGVTGIGAGLSYSVYTVTVNTGTGNGTIRLDLPATATIEDSEGNHFFNPYTDGETYTVYKGAAPTVPVLVSPANNALVADYLPTLDWNNSTEVMALANDWSYEVNVTAPLGVYDQTFNTPSGLSNSTYTFTTPLPANTTFTWKVRAYNDANQYSVWSATRTFRTKPLSTKLDTPVPTSPVDDPPSSTPLDNKRPTFIWDAVPGTTTYTLQILKDAKVVVTGTITAPLHAYTPIVDLLPNTTYTWQVKANGTIPSDYSTPFTFKTSEMNPPKPPVLTAPATGVLVDSTVIQILKWSPVAEVKTASDATSYPAASSYEIEYAADSTFTGSTVAIVNSSDPTPTQLSISIGTLSPNRTYSWRVRSYSADENYSAWSAVRTFRTMLATPVLNLPENSATTALDNKRPTFSWDEVPGATTYTLQILNGIKVINTGTITAPAYTYTPIVDLLPKTTYQWKVKANGTNAGNFSAPFTFTTSINPPKPPILFAPANNALVESAAEQTLDWTPVAGISTPSLATTYPDAASFEVEYATNSAFINPVVTKIDLDSQLSLPIGTLIPNRTYYWHVRAWSEAGAAGNRSAWSASRTFRTSLAMPVLKEPTDLQNNKRPTFVWDEVPGAISYTLQIWDSTKVVNTGTIIAPLHTYTPAVDLLPNTSYSWTVKANGANAGLYSVRLTFETGNPPAIPVLFSPANAALLVDSVTQSLDWNPVSASLTSPAAASFEVEYATNNAFTTSTIAPVEGNTDESTLLEIPTLPGRTYYWRVRSWSSWSGGGVTGDHSAWSLVRTIKVKFVAPELKSVTPTGGNLTFTWQSANELWTNYMLTIINSTTNKVVKSFTVPAPTTTYTIPAALLPAGTYKWQVKINGLYTPISSTTYQDFTLP